MNIEAGGGAVVVAAALAPGSQDQAALAFGHRRLQTLGRLGSGFNDCLREVLSLDHLRIAKYHGTFDGVLQFANVPRPLVEAEASFRLGRKTAYAPPAAHCGALEEVPRQGKDVLWTFAQRGHTQG